MSRVRQISVPDFQPQGWEEVAPGTVLLETMPKVSGPVVLSLNGEFLLRAHWPTLIGVDDHVEWLVDQPQDRETFRTFLAIATVVAAITPVLQGFAPYLAVASVAYNLLVPPSVLQQPNDPARAVYNASLSGNAARLDQPIWRVCGIDKITPPFAARPYYYFDDNNDQWYVAVFALGYGPLDILGEFIGKTPISSFADVLTHAYLAPGVLPTTAKTNVITSDNVTGMEMESTRYVGGFYACNPGQLAISIGIDLIAPYGIGRFATEDNENTTVTIAWRFEYQQVNDAGTPVDVWKELTSGTKTMSTNSVQRWTINTNLPFAMRVQVRGGRTNLKNTDPDARDTFQWAGMRAFLSNSAPLNANTSHYEIVMRASEQLSAQSQTDFNLLVHGKCRTWDSGWNCDIGDWANYVASRNPADWLGDLWTDPNWGEGMPDDRCDLPGLLELKTKWAARQDRFDYTFSQTIDAWTAGQLIASAGRARMFRRYGVRTLARDELADLGETAFTPRNCIGDMTIAEVQPKSSDPDGVIVEYVSNVTWTKATIECPCPGVSEMTRPIYLTLDGIKGATHARREGLYHAADMALRTRTVNAKTEMAGVLASLLLPVRWMPMIPGYGQTGDVVSWDANTLQMGLSEPPDFSAGLVYLTLRRDDGSLTNPVQVYPGSNSTSVQLPATPDFDIVVSDAFRMRPIYLLGALSAGDELVKITNRKDGGKSNKGAQYFDFEAVVDDPRVHQVDNAFLPGPADVQDPVGVPGETGGAGGGGVGGGIIVVVTLTDHTVVDGQGGLGGGSGAGVRFNNTGSLQVLRTANDGPLEPVHIAGEWLLNAVEPSVAGLFEIYAHANVDISHFTGDTLDTWLNLGTTREFINHLGEYQYVTLNIQIRRVGETTLQANRTMVLDVENVYEGGGG
jgi:hypothetical protein